MIEITAVYAGLLGLLYLALTARVILYRRQNSISLGHKDDAILERRIRGHGNFTENVPLGLLLLAGVELQGGADWFVHGLGVMLLVGRVLHGYALSFTSYSPLRVPGMGLTLVMIGVAALANLWLAL